MTLTSEYQYLGRSSALKSQSGGESYYLLLYAAAAETAPGIQRVSVKLRLASTGGSSFYGYSTTGTAFVEDISAVAWSWATVPAEKWKATALTAGGITYPAWTELAEGYVDMSVGYGEEKQLRLRGSFSFCAGAETWLPQTQKTVSVSTAATVGASGSATQPRLSVTSTPISKEVTIYTDAPEGFTHTLRYRFGEVTGTIGENVVAEAEWKSPLALCSQIPNSVTGTAVIYCDTYGPTGYIGTRQTTLQMKVPTTILPTVSVRWTDASDAHGLLGTLVQNVSGLRLQTTAEGIYGSTVTGTAVTLGGKPYDGGVITGSGTLPLVVTVTDSRGRTGRYTEDLSVAAYKVPSLKLSASRCTADGTADEAGSYAKITVTGSVSAPAGNGWKLQVNWGAGSESKTGNPGSVSYSKIAPADANVPVSITATLSDKLSQVKRTMTLSTGYATLDLLAGGKGIALGKAATREGFDCAMPAYFSGGVSGIVPGDIGAAPAGFGLGKGCEKVDSAKDIDKNGWWLTNTETADGNYWMLQAYQTNSGSNVVLEGYNLSGGNRAQRVKATNWQPWEWDNPPMRPLIGYRTCQRWNNKAVYRKLVEFGKLPASGSKTMSVGLDHGAVDVVGYDIRLIHSTGNYVYSHVPELTFGFQKGTDNWEAAAVVSQDLSEYSATVIVSYAAKE